MKKLLIILVAIGLYAQERDTIFLSDGDMLIKGYEKKFDFPVLDAIFDSATVDITTAVKIGYKEDLLKEMSKQNKVLISYPKIILYSRGREWSRLPLDERYDSYYAKEILILNEKGEIKKIIPLKDYSEERVYFSPKGEYFAISKVPQEWNPGNKGGILYNKEGEEIYRIEKYSPIAVSDEGYVIAVPLTTEIPPPPGGDFYIYDSKGNFISKIKNPDEKKFTPAYAKFSDDGEYVILRFGSLSGTLFMLIKKDGSFIWKKEIYKEDFSPSIGRFDFYPPSLFLGITFSHKKMTKFRKGKEGLKAFLINDKGNIEWTYNLTASGYAVGIIEKSRGKAYVISSKGYIWLIDLKSGKILKIHKEPWSPPADRPQRTSQRFTNIILLSSYVFINNTPKLLIFDEFLNKINEIDFKEKIFIYPYKNILFLSLIKNQKLIGFYLKQGG